MFGLGGTAVDQVGGIGFVGSDDRTHADAKEPVTGTVSLALEQASRGSENALRKLRR